MTTSNDFVVGSGRSLGEKNIGQLMMIAVDKGILIKGVDASSSSIQFLEQSIVKGKYENFNSRLI